MGFMNWHDQGEAEDAYWEWAMDGSRIAVIYGEHFFENKPIEVTRNEAGDIVNFKYIDDKENLV